MKKKPKSVPSKKVESFTSLPGPDELNEPPQNLGAYRILLFGPKAIGKTTMGSRFPNAITAQMERQRKGLKIRQVPVTAWEDLERFRDLAIEDDTVDTLIFDTIDVMYDLCLQSECSARGISHPGEMNDYGATWGAIKNSFKEFFDAITAAEKGIVCLSHEKKDTVTPRSGEPYDRLKPSCSNGAYAIVEETFDYIMYYGKHGKNRAISIRPFDETTMEVDCACGPEDHFLDPSGEPLSIFEIPNDPDTAYDVLEAAFNNQVWDAIRGEPELPKKKSKK